MPAADSYKAAATNGAGQAATIDGPLSNDTVAYTYDELGRVTPRTINGSANQVDWTFDALGRSSPKRMYSVSSRTPTTASQTA